MKLLICGGRNYRDKGAIKDALLIFKDREITEIIHGGARGADTLAGEVARGLGIKETVFPANWDKYGRSAGFIRNQQMLDEGKPDAVIACPGGNGTKDMVNRAKKAKVKHILILGGWLD